MENAGVMQMQIDLTRNNDPSSVPMSEIPPSHGPLDVQSQTHPHSNKNPISPTCILAFTIVSLFVPFFVGIFDYFAAVQLLSFIDTTKNDYQSSISYINDNIDNPSLNQLLICSNSTSQYNDDDLDEFIQYVLNNNVSCACSTINVICNNNNYYSDMTTNNYNEICQDSSAATCTYCNCSYISPYNKKSPQYSYALNQYESLSNDQQDQYCSLTKMSNTGDVSDLFGHAYRSCFAFLILGGIFVAFALFSGCKVRLRDIKFTVYTTKKHVLYEADPEPTRLNRDEFTIFVMCMVLVHLLHDVPQTVVGMLFAIYKQKDGGSDCLELWRNQDFKTDVGLFESNSGTSISSIISHDDVVARFFLASFLNVFISGFYMIRLFGFNVEKMLVYDWWKNTIFWILGLFCGFVCLLLILSPFWGVCWQNSGDLSLTSNGEEVLKWVFIAGMVSWTLIICLPFIFGQQFCEACGCTSCADCGCCGG